MTSGILVIGSLNEDIFLRLDRAAIPGETMLVSERFSALGGKGANQAVAAARAGGTVCMLGAVGDDSAGLALLANLRAAGVDCDVVAILAGTATGQAIVMSYPDGENTILVSSGANARVDSVQLQAAPSALQSAGLLLLQGELPPDSIEIAIGHAKKTGTFVLLDPAPAGVVRQAWLQHVTFVTPNRVELAELTGLPTTSVSDVERAAIALRKTGVGHVLAKLGKEGVLVVGADGTHLVRTIAVAPIDTTGAGDMFAGAFAAAFLECGNVLAATEFGAVAASLSTQRRGASGSFPSRPQIIEALTNLGASHWTGE